MPPGRSNEEKCPGPVLSCTPSIHMQRSPDLMVPSLAVQAVRATIGVLFYMCTSVAPWFSAAPESASMGGWGYSSRDQVEWTQWSLVQRSNGELACQDGSFGTRLPVNCTQNNDEVASHPRPERRLCSVEPALALNGGQPAAKPAIWYLS